jgi:hypothetical protein
MVRDCVWVCAVGVFDGREGGYSFVRLVDEDVRYVPPRETLIEGHSVESTRLLALPPKAAYAPVSCGTQIRNTMRTAPACPPQFQNSSCWRK